MFRVQMEFHLLHMLVFLTIALVTGQAALPPKQYWNSVLPNTPMPKAVKNLLQPHFMDKKSTSVGVGKGGVNVNASKGKPGGTSVNVGKGGVNLPEIYNQFSVKQGSLEAEIIKNTIRDASVLGKNVQAVSTEAENQTQLQKYTLTDGTKKMAGDKSVVCHKQNYAYAVFYCHATQATRAYMVSLEGADESKAQAVAVYHTDTSAWNPKHLAFQVLKVKPGTVLFAISFLRTTLFGFPTRCLKKYCTSSSTSSARTVHTEIL
ncbi:hypothetical protein P3X46_019970 [Hevea brasiliensis]|uniref:BURP domain-containing protein n=1 Tax=Hevea brasiliensis TaxID=3981 RepID=A0ABQ9LKF1_HEVBR|nr:hypothetical protein P3X46_019970 [Hevea brasiliensis]